MKLVPLVICSLLSGAVTAAIPVWPISGTTTMQDAMHTSFGPRVNYGYWDFHDGIDFPAPVGTTVFAILEGQVFREGPGGTDGYSNRHVVLRCVAPDGATIFVNYLHLDWIHLWVTEMAAVIQGQVIGHVGDDDATYAHLHFETRLEDNWESSSRHPLRWLPYTDTLNFTAPAIDRKTRMTPSTMAARIRFGAADRHEGDLSRVRIEFFNGGSSLGVRQLDVNDKTTIQEGNDESLMFTNDLALEGYQSSNMTLYGFPDLDQGLIARNIPAATNNVTVDVIDIGGRTVTGSPLTFSGWTGIDERASFEDGLVPPANWATVTTTGMSVQATPAAARAGTQGLRCLDPNSAASFLEAAAIELPVPAGRFEWVAEGWFRPVSFSRTAPAVVYPLAFLSGTTVAAAVWAWHTGTAVAVGLAAREFSTSLTGTLALSTGALNEWHHLRLTLLRLGTRQATVTLDVDGIRKGFLNWDARSYDPDRLRAGVALSSPALAVTIDVDALRLTENRAPPFPDFFLPSTTPPVGTSLDEVVVRPTAIRPGDGITCIIAERLVTGMTAEIYTRSGRKVRSFPAAASGTERWCLTDDAGTDLPSGVYLIVLRDPVGNRRTVKLALVR